ncbi:MAG: Ppx/GppA family phosphatase [Betaproteobacteria bacterium]|nr:Ppx/GppA family phosphatase [Betaproteobacteria bacterium]
MPERHLLAAVDLGSNSFRLLIGRVEQSGSGVQVQPLDALKAPVRLAAGLTPEGMIDAPAQQRALEALARFGERLRSFSPDAVRAVATNTLRVARNASHFRATAEAALGFPIDIIAGHEEARLIYCGAAHALPADGRNRLVVDIGGGSTECIIGQDYETHLLESVSVGCVSLTRKHFPDGNLSRSSFEKAVLRARAALAPIGLAYRREGWDYAVGTSGTAKSLSQIAAAQWGRTELTRQGLRDIADALLAAGSAERLRLEGLRADRRPVLAGGLAAMIAVFEELELPAMRYCPGALRQGLLYDLLGRETEGDMRELTVARMSARYGLDPAHGARVAETARAMLGQADRGPAEQRSADRDLLGWTAQLAEVGMSISHEDHHRHSGYILSHADMPGFSQNEQARMASLALGQGGGLRKMRGAITDERDWLMLLCLRVAIILHRRRDGEEVPLPALFARAGRVRIELPAAWAQRHPLSDESLRAEAATWNEVGPFPEVLYQTL